MLIAFAGFLGISLTLVISWFTGLFFLAFFVIPAVISIIAPFIDVPALKKNGNLVYRSLLLLSEKPKNNVVEIHGGSLFDYVFVIDKKMNGKERTVFILQQYLEGLLNLIEDEEINQSKNLKIRGTSYIINENTAEKLGFKKVKTNFIQTVLLYYNFFNLLISNSIAKGKFSFPKLSATKTYEADIKDIIDQKENILLLNEKLKNTLKNNY